MSVLDLIMVREQGAIKSFFNFRTIEVLPLPEYVDNQLIEYWRGLGFELHYLPEVEMVESAKFPGWRERPSQAFYKKIREGRISEAALKLPGKWVLIDARDKPAKQVRWVNSRDMWLLEKFGFKPKNYFKKWQRQQFKDDYLLPTLHKRGFGSRFCVSIEDIEGLQGETGKLLKLPDLDVIAGERSERSNPGIASSPDISRNPCNDTGGVERVQSPIIRLPHFIEYNYLGNAFYPQWASTSTWEWFEDRFEGKQYLAGASESLGVVGWEPKIFWSTILTFRPLIEL